MTYEQAIAYLRGLVDYERSTAAANARLWNLERIGRVLEGLGNPQRGLRLVHVAGTKGKGSTAAMIASILQAAGYRTGLFTSPHLVSFRERIRLNGEMIPREAVADLVPALQPHLQAASGPGGPPSFFEAYTALALAWFARQGVDAAVMETGLGGRLDATNVITPLVSVITRISYDHTAELGNSLEVIAAEKAGIIKPGVPVVSAPQVQAVWEVLRRAAEGKGADLHGVRELAAPESTTAQLAETLAELALGRPRSVIVVHRGADLAGIRFDARGLLGDYPGLCCPLVGEHQYMNAGMAVGAAEILDEQGLAIPATAIDEGLRRVRWRGRLETISRDPWIVLDGAHDPASALALRRAISLYAPERVILILGIARDKDIQTIGRQLCPAAEAVIFTSARMPRAAEPEALQQVLSGYCRHHVTTPDVAAALDKARGIAGPRDLILVTGSLYLVGEAQRALGVAEEE